MNVNVMDLRLLVVCFFLILLNVYASFVSRISSLGYKKSMTTNDSQCCWLEVK